MKRKCIFKAYKGDERWYLYQCPDEKATRGCIYRVYRGRKWYDRISWFGYEMALSQLLAYCSDLGSVNWRD